MGSCVAWLYRLWCLGLGGAANSPLVKVSKDPSSQRAGLLPLAGPSLSCQCPGSLQPSPCVPKHPLSWLQPLGADALAQQRASAEMPRGSLEEGKLWVQSGTFGKQQLLFHSPLLARGWKQPSLSRVNLCLPLTGTVPKRCNPDPDWGVDPFGNSPTVWWCKAWPPSGDLP